MNLKEEINEILNKKFKKYKEKNDIINIGEDDEIYFFSSKDIVFLKFLTLRFERKINYNYDYLLLHEDNLNYLFSSEEYKIKDIFFRGLLFNYFSLLEFFVKFLVYSFDIKSKKSKERKRFSKKMYEKFSEEYHSGNFKSLQKNFDSIIKNVKKETFYFGEKKINLEFIKEVFFRINRIRNKLAHGIHVSSIIYFSEYDMKKLKNCFCTAEYESKSLNIASKKIYSCFRDDAIILWNFLEHLRDNYLEQENKEFKEFIEEYSFD